MRVRGLKLYRLVDKPAILVVAPHAGAWIETIGQHLSLLKRYVAPHAGAWIETFEASPLH